jgi:ribosomal protein S16
MRDGMRRTYSSTRDFQIVIYDAVEQPDGSYLNNKGTIGWYNKHGRVHKEDGPAMITESGAIFWYHNGVRMTFEDWLTKSTASDEHKMMLRLQYA